MSPWKALFCFSAIVFALAFAPASRLATAGDDDAELMPRLGETTVEFEARLKGLARPVSPLQPLTVTVVADQQGHFFVEPIVNGTRLRMLVDTGATLVVLSGHDARRLGINPQVSDFQARVSTANGSVLVAPILLKEVVIGDISVRDIPAAVFPENKLQIGLLGMSFLSKLSHFEVTSGRLILKQ